MRHISLLKMKELSNSDLITSLVMKVKSFSLLKTVGEKYFGFRNKIIINSAYLTIFVL